MKRPEIRNRPNPPKRNLQEKAEILRAHQRSGLSLQAFAQKHKLCYASLRRWRTLQCNAAKVPISSAIPSDPQFVSVKIEGEGEREVLGGDYVLGLAGGRSLKIPEQFEPESLRRLLRVLEGVK